jgi:hypothetical protein
MHRIRIEGMPRMDPAAGIAFAADGLTAAAGAFNAACLTARIDSERLPGRRFAQSIYQAQRSGYALDPFFAPGPWLSSRLLVSAGVLCMSLLILRRRAP